MIWQMHEAKQQFSALVRRALAEGPQIVTKRGEAVVVVMAIGEFERLQEPKPSFAEFLLNSPDFSQLELSRDRIPAREVTVSL
jgi:prevent-host-death family protein